VRSSEAEALSILEGSGLRAGPGSDFLAEIPSVRLAFTGLSEQEGALAGSRFRRVLIDHPGVFLFR
jgi:hypothetical protein